MRVLISFLPHRVVAVRGITTAINSQVLQTYPMSELVGCHVCKAIFRPVDIIMLVQPLIIVEAEIAFYDLAGVRGVKIHIRIGQWGVLVVPQVYPSYGILFVRVAARRFIRCPVVVQRKFDVHVVKM